MGLDIWLLPRQAADAGEIDLNVLAAIDELRRVFIIFGALGASGVVLDGGRGGHGGQNAEEKKELSK
jgi:hypothetical protein